MNIHRAAEVLVECKEIIQEPNAHFNIEQEERDDGSFTRLYVGTRERSMMLKIGRGSLQNFR